MGKTWIEYPIYRLSGPDGRTALIPNQLEMNLFELQVEKGRSEVAKLSAASSNPDTNVELQFAKRDLEQVEEGYENAKASVAAQRDRAVKVDYSITWPTMGELLSMQDTARDFILGRPFVDDNKMTGLLLKGRIKRDGQLLTEQEVNDLEPDEAKKLHAEINSRTFPNLALVPFWKIS